MPVNNDKTTPSRYKLASIRRLVALIGYIFTPLRSWVTCLQKVESYGAVLLTQLVKTQRELDVPFAVLLRL